MIKPTNFAVRLSAFLTHHLSGQRNVSTNTIKAYRDAFALLLRFCRDARQLPPERLTIEQLDVSVIEAYLDHLEKDRRCSIRTRNHRLAAIHAFFRYVQLEEPGLMLLCQQVLSIPYKRYVQRAMGYLTGEQLGALVGQPNLRTSAGRRDAVLLSVLYDTGARVQELIDLSPKDVRLESPAFVQLLGKGRKIRAVPLMDHTVTLLRQYIEEHRLARPERVDEPLFSNARHVRLSRSGVAYILNKHAHQAGKTQHLPDKISPHWLRHTKGMHLLEAGVELDSIRDILGHEDVKTTEVYVRASLAMKRRALEKIQSDAPKVTLPSWQKDGALLDWLRSI